VNFSRQGDLGMCRKKALAFPLKEQQEEQHVPTDNKDDGSGGVQREFIRQLRRIGGQFGFMPVGAMKQPN